MLLWAYFIACTSIKKQTLEDLIVNSGLQLEAYRIILFHSCSLNFDILHNMSPHVDNEWSSGKNDILPHIASKAEGFVIATVFAYINQPHKKYWNIIC